MNIKRKTMSHHNDRGCCCCCVMGLGSNNTTTTSSSFNRYKNMRIIIHHNNKRKNNKQKKKKILLKKKTGILVMIAILFTVVLEWKQMQPKTMMDYYLTTATSNNISIPIDSTTITGKDNRKNVLVTDDRNDDDDGSSGLIRRSYVTFFDNNDHHHFDFYDDDSKQQQQRSKCWISSSSHPNTTTESTSIIKLLGCGSDGHAFQTTMTCQKRHHGLGDNGSSSIKTTSTTTTTFDVDVVLKTNTTRIIPPLRNEQRPAGSTYITNTKNTGGVDVTIDDMIDVESMKEIYNTLIMSKSRIKTHSIINTNNNLPNRQQQQQQFVLLNKHFMVPFGTIDIPTGLLQSQLLEQHNSCHQNVKLEFSPEKMITVAIMQYIHGMPLDKYLKIYTKIASSSKDSYAENTYKLQEELKRQRSSLTKTFIRDLVCMYQHMFTQNFIHDDMWLNHFLVNLDGNNDNNNNINNNNTDRRRLPPTALSLIDYGRYTILNNDSKKEEDNNNIIVDAYGNQNHIQVLQFMQLLELLGVICYNDIKFKSIISLVENENSKSKEETKTKTKTEQILPKKQPPVSKKLYQIKYQSYFPVWMNLMAQCSDGSGSSSSGGSAQQLSLLYKTLFSSGNDDESPLLLNKNVTIQLGIAYEILLKWITNTFRRRGNNDGDDDTYDNYDYSDNMCFS